MTLTLPPPAAARFVKIIGLLGSDQPGEVVSAAAAATRLLREHRLTWADVVRPCPPPQLRRRPCGDHRPRALRLLERPGLLSPWEEDFLRSIARLATLTPRQQAALERIEARQGA